MRFRHHVNSPNGPVEYTLYPEKTFDDGWVIGWCPELERTMAVHPGNVVDESIRSPLQETPAKPQVEAPSGLEPLFPSAEPKADR